MRDLPGSNFFKALNFHIFNRELETLNLKPRFLPFFD